jgi:D-alanyl-D-alanine carboxypeptidase
MEVASKGQTLAGYPYAVGNSFYYPLAEEERDMLQSRLVVLDMATMNYRLGERGALEWYLNDQKIGSIPVYDIGSARMSLPERKPMSDAAMLDYKKATTERDSFIHSITSVINALFEM